MESKMHPDQSYPMNQQPIPGQPMPQPYTHPQPPPPYYDQPNIGFQQPQPHPQAHPQAQQQHAPQTVVQTVYMSTRPNVGPEPCGVTCPSCRQQVVTRLDYETTSKTHIIALILCCFICWPCAWIPYVMDSCKNANHFCPNCGSFIGTYKN